MRNSVYIMVIIQLVKTLIAVSDAVPFHPFPQTQLLDIFLIGLLSKQKIIYYGIIYKRISRKCSWLIKALLLRYNKWAADYENDSFKSIYSPWQLI